MPLPIPTSSAVVDGSISITCPPARNARRRMFRDLKHGRIPGFAPICCDSNDPFTVECGLKKRLCRDLPAAEPGVIDEFRSFVKTWCRDNLPHARPLAFEEWLETTSYNDARKNELRSVHDSLKGGVPTRREAKRVKTFVKTESYPALKHCRTINSRVDKVKVFMGPRAKAVEQVVYECKEFIKHTPVPERPAKIASLRQAGRHYYLSDYTAFESHFISEFMDACECELYRWVLSDDVHVSLMCDIMTGMNNLKTRSGIRCSLRGRRMSGEMTTSVGNGFSNLMLAMFVAYKKGGKIEGFVEGDDGIFVTDVELAEADFARVGFTCKLLEVNDPCECIPVFTPKDLDLRFGVNAGAFCGICSSPSGEIIRDPRKFCCEFGWTSSFINAGQPIMDQLARAKALSACYETPQCPINGVLARLVLKETRGVRPRFVQDGYHTCPSDEMRIPDFAPTPECRALFARHFGVSVSEQLAIEQRLWEGNLDIGDLLHPTPDQSWYAARFVEAS